MKVFLSSTALDLAEYRKVADATIRGLRFESVAMEFFGPLPETPVEECERLARESDVLVCIVAHRYGFVPEKGRGSITRREVIAAKAAGKDVLVWIVADNHPWTEKKEQDLLADPNVLTNPDRVAEVTEGVAGLLEFKAWLRTTFTPDTFTTPDDLGRKIAVALANYVKGHAVPPIAQDKVSISRLPTTGSELFGREKELQLLDEAWNNPSINMVSFVAWGGVGKTALVNHWLKRRMARDNYRGAEKVYGWSFFSQGTSERATSADLFIDQALRWFSDQDPTAGTPWDKGARLARHIRQSRTLLILDGLEPLQYPPGSQEGRLKDVALHALLVELAAQQPGLCVISTRERVGDLIEFEKSTVQQKELEYLSPRAGAQVLRSLKVKGDDKELEDAADELKGHAFSLTLLGSYLDEVLEGDIRRREEIENLFDDTRFGDAAQKMVAAYEKWLGEGIELAILRLLGLFDRPANAASIEALVAPPVIPDFTEPLQDFQGLQWNRAVAKLRRIKLLAEAEPAKRGSLDAHPLVRENFKQQLKRERPNAWREANNRLYEHLKKTTKEFPESIEEMSPLYAAVSHACAAERHSEALTEVYFNRIQRGTTHFNWHSLGAYGADLSTLSHFFKRVWDEPVASLSNTDKGFVLNEVGVDLRALGRLEEAVESTRAGLEITDEDWINRNRLTNNLADLYVVIGNLTEAHNVAHEGVEISDRSGDLFGRIVNRATFADVLHRQGKIEEAVTNFSAAETLQLQSDKFKHPYLVSWWGFLYCDLLLDQGEYAQVKDRASKALELSKEHNWFGMMGLEYLALGRVSFLQMRAEQKRDFGEAEDLMNKGVHFLRQGGQIDRLLYGLLARANLYRHKADLDGAERDLSEVFRIATRSGMGLHLADYHLGSTRLRLVDDKDKAREHLTSAKGMIEQMGYKRRDKEVNELEVQLG